MGLPVAAVLLAALEPPTSSVRASRRWHRAATSFRAAAAGEVRERGGRRDPPPAAEKPERSSTSIKELLSSGALSGCDPLAFPAASLQYNLALPTFPRPTRENTTADAELQRKRGSAKKETHERLLSPHQLFPRCQKRPRITNAPLDSSNGESESSSTVVPVKVL